MFGLRAYGYFLVFTFLYLFFYTSFFRLHALLLQVNMAFRVFKLLLHFMHDLGIKYEKNILYGIRLDRV